MQLSYTKLWYNYTFIHIYIYIIKTHTHAIDIDTYIYIYYMHLCTIHILFYKSESIRSVSVDVGSRSYNWSLVSKAKPTPWPSKPENNLAPIQSWYRKLLGTMWLWIVGLPNAIQMMHYQNTAQILTNNIQIQSKYYCNK